MDRLLWMGCLKALEVLGNSTTEMLGFSPESQPVALPCPLPLPTPQLYPICALNLLLGLRPSGSHLLQHTKPLRAVRVKPLFLYV